MSADDPTSRTFSLRRWSRRKLEAAHAATEPAPAAPNVPAIVPAPPPADARAAAPGAAAESAAPALPPVESLTIDSDFTAFFAPKVDEALRRKALKQLFRDPHFNVMDGLDTYIDDYSRADPISAEIVREMVQGRYIFDPPKTQVNEPGAVEDLPADVAAAEPAAKPTGALSLPAAKPPASDHAGLPADVDAPDAAVPATTRDASLAGPAEKPDPATR